MSEIAEFADLLSCVYDAALDISLWPLAIERACDFLKCMGGMIGAYDVLQTHSNISAAWGYQPEFMETFQRTIAVNPSLRASFRLGVGEVMTLGDFMPFSEIEKTQVYLEWAKPQGIVDVVQTNLEKTPLALAALAFSRHKRQGLVDPRARQRMTLIAPHFRRAVLIAKVVDLARIEAAAFAGALDGLAAAVFLVDENGTLLHSNISGDAMLAAGELFRVVEHRLIATNAKAASELAASFAAAARGDGAVARSGIGVPLKGSDGKHFAAHVLPMTSGSRAAAAGGSAVAALFVRSVDLTFPTAVTTISEVYRLTPSEVRVLHVVLAMSGIPATALALHVTENTVKTHLSHIFQKTGARNQVDLVKLAAGLSSPLAQPN